MKSDDRLLFGVSVVVALTGFALIGSSFWLHEKLNGFLFIPQLAGLAGLGLLLIGVLNSLAICRRGR